MNVMRDEILSVDDVKERYQAAFDVFCDALDKHFLSWREAKNIEAEIIVNGGYGEIVIDGKNAEVREAQLRLARNLNPRWVQLDDNIRSAAVGKEEMFEDMKMCAAFLAYETALVNERAATAKKD